MIRTVDEMKAVAPRVVSDAYARARWDDDDHFANRQYRFDTALSRSLETCDLDVIAAVLAIEVTSGGEEEAISFLKENKEFFGTMGVYQNYASAIIRCWCNGERPYKKKIRDKIRNMERIYNFDREFNPVSW